MPEGDTIYRSALRLQQILPSGTIVQANANARYFKANTLCKQTFGQVESRGKHLLMHVSDGRVLHSHMGMTGSWHTCLVGEPWRKSPRQAALQMQIQPQGHIAGRQRPASVVVCFSPKTLELLTATQLRRHPMLSRLGPDLMQPNLDRAHVIERFRVHNITPIGEAVMNQTIVCGSATFTNRRSCF